MDDIFIKFIRFSCMVSGFDEFLVGSLIRVLGVFDYLFEFVFD